MMAVAVDEATETRTAMTGSWLLPQWRGQGLGKEARQAVLHLLFAELGLDAAWSGVHPDNGPSMGVSRALGYEPDGEFPFSSGAGTVTSIRLTLRRERWERQRRDDIRVEGLDRCRDLLGL
jgi:RimJ/RimL family protein N-acetyltransferase